MRDRIHKSHVKIANREYPDQSLIWVVPICFGIFGKLLVLKIEEHLPSSNHIFLAVPKRLASTQNIPLPVADNCPTWAWGREIIDLFNKNVVPPEA